MSNWIIAMMLGVSIFLGSIAVVALIWAIKKGQFDDEEKFLNAVKFDGVEDLNDAANLERKKEELRKKAYKPE
ncbi:cbb3-type cytochrome oxidase assembly protein CcoS [Sulfurimonas paralvinellae]|uniref:Cbb3-type cytochrome oxidase assembly protein CcoS n=1 Tax=Sulfurimonas paralvinellae TaxID=317658 RepID=A0A7M1B8Y7_9BACT|nr:cbb3-type cytochrome oxidase assembly protein CcoS [Sulfurimonas paralvinellae]QOP46135.1 cbb3-type cytochrome oxidase assembly protein CcoS [Sulfurimonas paralvinellae]